MLGETVAFLLLNVTFIAVIFLGVSRFGTASGLYEEAYAKQIALLIDGAKPGSTITLDVSELYQIAQKEGISPVFQLECEKNQVYVKSTSRGGYRYKYVTQLSQCYLAVDHQNRKVIVKT